MSEFLHLLEHFHCATGSAGYFRRFAADFFVLFAFFATLVLGPFFAGFFAAFFADFAFFAVFFLTTFFTVFFTAFLYLLFFAVLLFRPCPALLLLRTALTSLRSDSTHFPP